MNAPIRRVSTLVALLFVSLLVSSTVIQGLLARGINARPDNRRTLLNSYAQERGQILVGDTPVATSVAAKDELKWLRTYSNGPLYAPVTGYYSFTFGTGGGLEASDNSLLNGRDDKLFYKRVSDFLTGRKPKGASLQLTINAKAQQAAARALGEQRGAAVALDPKTGAILALVTSPSYDPNKLATHTSKAAISAWNGWLADPARPLTDRAIAGDLYPPGSTFKVITAAAALSSGKWTKDSTIPGPARLPLPQTRISLPNDNAAPCGNGHPTLTYALQESCNTSFGWLGLQLGGDAIRQQAAKFGFGDDLGIPMHVTPSSVPAALNKPQTAQAAIGQYDVRVTPMQMAMVAAGVANGGTVMKPYLVQSVITDDLKTIDSASPEQLSQAVTPAVATQLKDMMLAVVANGTGTAAQMSGVEVAGKTGTAQHAVGAAPHAWFISFAPAQDPKVAVAVVVEDGGRAGNEAFGGTVAAPIAKAIMEAVLSK